MRFSIFIIQNSPAVAGQIRLGRHTRRLFWQVVKGPVTKHLPADSVRIGFTRTAPNVSRLQDFADELEEDSTPVFVVGSHAHGKVDVSYTDKWISVSQYPLSAACCLGRITNALEAKWNIV
jgi:rRNA small subunit pseudouridine methyltransferase Nep1